MYYTHHAKQVLVRHGFSDYDTYGNGNYFAAATGNLDAPTFMPQGSVRKHCTIKQTPQQSIGHRDWQNLPMGDPHDGQGRAIC